MNLMLRIAFLTVFVQMHCVVHVLAQATEIKFQRISLEDGLSQTSINCIIQDRKGFLWFGTQDGLNKYDGYTFTVFRNDSENPNSLSNNFITALHEDRYGYLWIGTSEGGLNRIDRDTQEFTKWVHEPGNPRSLGHNSVQSILEDREGILWLGTRGGGLQQYDRDADTFRGWVHEPENPKSLSHNYISTIYEDRSGNLWIGTQGGLNRFDREAQEFTRWLHEPGNPRSLSQNIVTSVIEDNSGTIWIGTRNAGLNEFDPETGVFTHHRHERGNPDSISDDLIWSILEDHSDNLWIGTGTGGLNKFDRNKERFSNVVHEPGNLNSLSNNSVQTILEDNSGVLWVGTNGGGINKYIRNGALFRHYVHQPWNPHSLSHNFVFSIHEDRHGDLWIGTGGGGLNKFNRREGTATRWVQEPENPHSLSHNSVMTILEDRAGRMWFGTNGGGLNRYDPENNNFRRWVREPGNPNSISQDNIWSMVEDPDGILWLGTPGNGITEFDPHRETFRRWVHEPANSGSILDDGVRTLYQDRSGVLWVGYVDQSLSRLDRSASLFTHWRPDPDTPGSLPPYSISVIHEDRSGTLWLGTLQGGLVRFDRNAQTFTSYREKDGLANDVVYGILEDAGGSLWISTNRGISNFNPETKTFKNYDVHDGLQSNEFNSSAYHQSRSGEMYFGGVNGVNAFNPDNIRVNPYIPPVVITQVVRYDEVIKSDISESTEIELSYEDKYLTFEFVALDFRNSRKNQYAYMLEGFDTSWIHSNARRYVSYTNLDPGQYTFRAKGSSSDGIWNESGVSIELVVTPPFWELWWFRLAIAMLVCGAALGWHNLRIRHIRDLNKTLESKVAERTSEIQKTMQKLKDTQIQLVQSEKMASLGTLAAGVAHEVNSPMGVVKSAADVSKRCISKITDIIGKSSKLDEIKQDPGFRKAVEMMYQNNSLIISASQAVSKIVQSLSNFARLDESDIKFDDIHIGIDNTLILLHSRIKDRIQIVKEYGNLPLVCCYHSQMNQVFMNLLSNAIESIDNQGVITISTSTVDQQVVIAIKDDGNGIPPDQIDKIFNPGFTTKGVGVGTGLGLSICYNIIEKHKGVLQVNSELGQGTDFTITIPINNVAEGIAAVHPG